MAAAGTTIGETLQRHALTIAGFCLLGLVGAVVWLWETHFDLHDVDDENYRELRERIVILETQVSIRQKLTEYYDAQLREESNRRQGSRPWTE